MFKLLAVLFALLTPGEKRRYRFLLTVSTFSSLLQVANIGMVFSFVALLANPDLARHHDALALAYETFGLTSQEEFLLLVGIVVLITLITSNAILALTASLFVKFIWFFYQRFSISVLQSALAQPYLNFLGMNSAHIASRVFSECSQVSHGAVLPSIRILSNGVTAILLTGLLMWLNPLASGMALGLISTCYAVVFYAARKHLDQSGKQQIELNKRRFRTVKEAFGSVKEIKVMRCESAYVDEYAKQTQQVTGVVSTASILSQLPRYFIETLAMGGLLTMILYHLYSGIGLQSILPLLSAFTFAGYRLLPAVQAIYADLGNLRLNAPAVESLHQQLITFRQNNTNTLVSSTLPFNREIQLSNIEFTYPAADEPTIKNVSLRIPKQSFCAFVGLSGAGKTTMGDLLLGILSPQQGQIVVDGNLITADNIERWQQNLGYVPQDIFIADTSIRSNIAFGSLPANIDQQAVENAARQAQIHDLVTALPDGYDTVVGESGVRLSGGQRQRLGIARALYRNPLVLVLDEATSALDNVTESEVHEALLGAKEIHTVVVIAHRLSTIVDCDKIFVFQKGALVGEGNYASLMQNCSEFRNLVSGQKHSCLRRETPDAPSIVLPPIPMTNFLP